MKRSKLVVFFVVLVVFFVLSGKSKISAHPEYSQIDNGFCCQSEILSEENIKCIDSERTFLDRRQSYNFETNKELLQVYFTGLATLEKTEIENNLVCCNINIPNGNSNINLTIIAKDGTEFNQSLFFSESKEGVFYSTELSMDVAMRNAGHKLSYNLCEEPTEDSSSAMLYSIVDTPGIPTISGHIFGNLLWTDDQNNTHPLINSRIRISIMNGFLKYETFTDNKGNYDFTFKTLGDFKGSYKLEIHIFADNEAINVVYNNEVYEKVFTTFVENGGTLKYSYTFSPEQDGDMGRAMHIFQAGENYAKYVEYLNFGPIDKCSFNYPYYGDSSNFDREKTINIASKEGKNGFPNSYASWDVIGHEYGHFVEKCFNFSDNPGGKHYINTNAIDDFYQKLNDLQKAKEKGLKLAWAEGWPTFWAITAQSTFPEDIKKINTVGDSKFSSYKNFEYSLNAYSESKSFGDADEVAISRILYKLWTPEKDEYDDFFLDGDELWQLVIESKPCYFYQYIDALYNYGISKHGLGKLLSKYNITVSNLSIKKGNYLDEVPTFKWSCYKGSKKIYNNTFVLVFLDENNNELISKEIVTNGETNYSYELSKEEWGKVISAPGNKYSVYITSQENLYFYCGEYYSEQFVFEKPTEFYHKSQIKANEWGFEPQYFFETNKEGHDTTSIYKNGLTITTNRLRCGYIEDSYVVLSPRRQNAGKAYLELYFDKPVYSYLFGITLWSKNEGINDEYTAVIEEMDADGNWHLSWDLMKDLPNGFSTKDQQVDRYESICSDGIYGLRFVVTSPAIGDRNKGRLCIEDIVLNTDPNDLHFISSKY